jgi:hypothetical protein
MESVVLFGALLVSAAIVGSRVPAIRGRGWLGARMGQPTWDYTKSWASTFTVVGAIVTTLLAASGVVPAKPTLLPKLVYQIDGLFFGALIIVAPFVFIAFRSQETIQSQQGDVTTQYQGYVSAYLLATTVTLWAVLGEILTVILLVWESSAIPSIGVVALLFGAAMAAAAILIAVYVWNGLFWTVQEQHGETPPVVTLQPQATSVSELRLYQMFAPSALPEAESAEQAETQRTPAPALKPALPNWNIL